MLLSSILRILDQYQEQPKVVEKTNANVGKFELGMASSPEESSGLHKIEKEIAAAAELLRPSTPHPAAGTPPAGPNLEELIRAVTKFEKSEESRVVDVFE